MDRTLVHTSGKVKGYSDKLRWFHNIPFRQVPKNLIEQFYAYTYEEYLEFCPMLSRMYWNIAGYGLDSKSPGMKVFLWGSFDPLERLVHVIRITIHPELFRVDGSFLEVILEELERYALELKVVRIYWITDSWRSFLRKLPNKVQLSEGKVIEVVL